MNINQVVITGNIVNDLELVELDKADGGTFKTCSFTVAVNEGFGDNSKTTFIPCKVFNKMAENVVKMCKKGTTVSIVGSIDIRRYGAENDKKTFTSIHVKQMEFIKGLKERDAKTIQSATKSNSPQPSSFDISDDDLPF